MPRQKRPFAPDTVHHLIARFINREFRLTSLVERDEYLRRLPRLLKRIDALMLAYGLMSSHVHLDVEAGQEPVSRLVHPLHTGFGRYLNKLQGRLGPVFANRFETILADEEHAARLIAYIHNNPVRAGVVRDPADSSWTSHRAYIGDVAAPPWLDVARGLARCGFDSSPSGRLAFHAFVCARSGDLRDPELSGGSFARARARIRELSGAPVEISAPILTPDDDGLAHEILAPAGTPLRPRWDGDPVFVLELVASHTGVSVDAIQARTRERPVVCARRLLLMVGVRLGIPQSVLSALAGISEAAASKLLHQQEAETARLAPLAEELAGLCWRSRELSVHLGDES